jgi:HK97 family phage portal protein
MSILDRTFARAFAKAAPPTRPPGRLRAASVASERWNIPDPASTERQANLYANLSPLQTAIGSVAKAVATTPFSVSQRTKGGLKAIEDHPFELLLEHPNDVQDQFEFLLDTASWLAAAGQCYWWLNTLGETATPDELWVIPATKIQPVPDGAMGVRGYLFDNGGATPVPLEEWEVVHFKDWNPLNRYVGLSGLQALGIDATGDLNAQKYNANFYGKNNAKAAGILAFAEPIEEGRWQRLIAARDEEHGGTQNNRIMMLRGVGEKGVTWLQTQLSQVDIQYLEQRRFTKEEVFERFAPGLASILAINATEANSTAGKDTFREFAVFALNVAIAAKVTHKLLPLYGPGLVGAFEDVRRVDTLIELQEQQEYSKSHSILEIRAKYYQDKPLGDDRDKLLPAEVGKGMTDGRNPADKPPPPPQLQPFTGQSQNGPPPVAVPADLAAGKALDRRRWYSKAERALRADGRADVPFDPEYLSDGEAMSIRASLKHAQTADDVWRAVGEG